MIITIKQGGHPLAAGHQAERGPQSHMGRHPRDATQAGRESYRDMHLAGRHCKHCHSCEASNASEGGELKPFLMSSDALWNASLQKGFQGTSLRPLAEKYWPSNSVIFILYHYHCITLYHTLSFYWNLSSNFTSIIIMMQALPPTCNQTSKEQSGPNQEIYRPLPCVHSALGGGGCYVPQPHCEGRYGMSGHHS